MDSSNSGKKRINPEGENYQKVKAHDQTAKWDIEHPNARRRSPKRNIRAGRHFSRQTRISIILSVQKNRPSKEASEKWQKPKARQIQKSSNPRHGKRIKEEPEREKKIKMEHAKSRDDPEPKKNAERKIEYIRSELSRIDEATNKASSTD